MERAVTEASELRAHRIVIEEGKRPYFLTAAGASRSKSIHPPTGADMDQLFISVFSHEDGLSHLRRGVRRVNILGFGEVDCIGLPDLRQMNIYPPSGRALYELDRKQFLPKSTMTEARGGVEHDAAREGVDDDMSDMFIDPTASIGGKTSLPSAEQSPNAAASPATPASQEKSAAPSGELLQVDFSAPRDGGATAPERDAAADQPAPAQGGASAKADLQSLLVQQDDTAASSPAAGQDTVRAGEPDPLPEKGEEAEGVRTAMDKVTTQPDRIVAERGAAADDGQDASTAPAVKVITQPDRVVAAREAATDDGQDASAAPAVSEEEEESASSRRVLSSASTVSDGSNALDKLLQEMKAKRASDLHLSCDCPVMMRIAGQMEKVNASEKITSEVLRGWLDPLVPATEAARLERSGDIDFTYELRGVGRFRVNVLKDLHGIGAVLRYVPAVLSTLEELAAPDIVKKFCYLSKGLVILSGSAGSGRSTTMAAMVDIINTTRKAHLLAIEEQIEFVHTPKNSLIRQREIGTHTHSVLDGLRAALREDPDIICTDEIREAEAMAMVLKCAEAGRLVFSMMPARNSVLAIDGIINQFTPAHQSQVRHLLANTLRGVICQTLLRTKDGGRVAAWEVLIASSEAAAMIKTGRTQQLTAHMIAHRVKGNILLNDSLLKLVSEETVSLNDALIAAVDKRACHALAHRRGLLKLSA